MNQPIEVIQAIADRLHGEGVFHHVDSVDEDSGTLIVFCTDGNPYEVRVRRVTEADVDIDNDGVLPGPITPQRGRTAQVEPHRRWVRAWRWRGRSPGRRAVVSVPQVGIDGFLDVLREWSATPCPSFCCSEVDRLADLARAVGAPDVAHALRIAHAEADVEGDFTWRGSSDDDCP